MQAGAGRPAVGARSTRATCRVSPAASESLPGRALNSEVRGCRHSASGGGGEGEMLEGAALNL